MADDTESWGVELSPRERPAPKESTGPRHSWADAGARTHRCVRCGLLRLTERPSGGARSVYGNIPVVKYKFPKPGEEWRDHRPPCLDPKANPRQASLFDAEYTADARAQVPRPAPSGRIHEGELVEPPAPAPKPIAPKTTPRVFTLHMDTLPEGVDVVLEIVDDEGFFASEWSWTIFFHTEGKCRAPKIAPMHEQCSVTHVDKLVAGLMRVVGTPIRGLWIVAKRRDPPYTRAWEGTGSEWIFREKGEVGEG